MDRRRKWSDEELIEWIKSFETKKELRNDSYGKYQACLARGLNIHFNKLNGNSKYTDEELIEWIKSFETRKDIKAQSIPKYQACLRRGLHEYFPKRRVKGECKGGMTSEERDRLREERKSVRIEKRRLEKEDKKRLKEEDKKRLKEERLSKKKMNSKLGLNVASKVYRSVKLQSGLIICGRCLEEKSPSRMSSSICQSCYKSYIKYNGLGVDHNKFNIRDPFCNTQIKYHEKVFDIGVRVDERTQNYLRLIGYDFIFKDVYED
jgi:hypothetical protein